MNEKPIAIIIDTNYNEGSKNCAALNNFRFGRYNDYIDFIEVNDLIEKIDVFIPEVVIREALEHQSAELKDCIETVNKQLARIEDVFSGVSGCIDVKDEDREKYIEQIEKRIRDSAKIISIPDISKEFFDKILEKAVCKNPPFKRGESDNGFKDAVIWESIKEHFKDCIKDYSDILFFTKDKGFIQQVEILGDDFFEITGKKILITGQDIITHISGKFKIHLDFIKYLQDSFYSIMSDSKNGSTFAFDGSTWCINKIVAGHDPTIKSLEEDSAEIYVSFYVEVFQLNDPNKIFTNAEVTFKVDFGKDENLEWIYDDEIVGFRSIS